MLSPKSFLTAATMSLIGAERMICCCDQNHKAKASQHLMSGV